nr:prolyl-tRNA synthetase associated domain-containing protein [Natranaerobius trueperi]
MSNQDKVYKTLDSLNIDYKAYKHEPVYTIEETVEQVPETEKTHCKNLFLRDYKGKNHFLVILTSEKVVDLKKLASQIDSSRLSFASARRLSKYLDLEQGSVSPFGLINDTENEVQVIIDQDVQNQDNITFHPNVNTESITISYNDFVKYLDWVGNKYCFLKI